MLIKTNDILKLPVHKAPNQLRSRSDVGAYRKFSSVGGFCIFDILLYPTLISSSDNETPCVLLQENASYVVSNLVILVLLSPFHPCGPSSDLYSGNEV